MHYPGFSFKWIILLYLTVSCIARSARADDGIGRIPVLRVFAQFDTTIIPVRLRKVDFDGSLGPVTSELNQGFGFGPALQLRLDLDSTLISIDGFYNPIRSGITYLVRTGIVLPALGGGRSGSTLTTYCGREYTATERIDCYEHHPGKSLPGIYGAMLGLSAVQTRDAVIEEIGIQPEHRRPGATLVGIEAGYAVVSAQYEVLAAAVFEVTHFLPGLRWSIQYGFPLAGPVPMYFHISGDHLFGSDSAQALAHLISMGLGIGTSMGVSP